MGLPGEYSAPDWPMDTDDAQRPTATEITGTTNKVKHNRNSKHSKCAKKSTKADFEYTIAHNACNVGKAKNTQCFIRRYGNTAADNTIDLGINTPSQLTTCYCRVGASDRRKATIETSCKAKQMGTVPKKEKKKQEVRNSWGPQKVEGRVP